jgi:hypothetical protein
MGNINPNTTDNSFSTILANFIRLQNNSIETLQQIQQATTSNSDTVTIKVNNGDGTYTSYTIPSFGYLKGSIDRIDKTVGKMMGFDGSEAYVRLPDGSFKKIYQSQTITNPAPVGNLPVPSKFIAENNWFFESMYTPALKVTFDVTPYIPQQESKIFTKRLILNLDSKTKLQYWTNNIAGRNDIDYVKFLVDLQKQAITYFIDEGVIDLPLSIVRYTGDFTVVNIEDREIKASDGTVSKKRWYLFNSVKYTDNLSLSTDTLSLKVGDRLIKAETTYEIIEIDTTTNYLRVKRINGYDPFVVGEPVSFYSETFSPKYANVGIGFNEYDVVFFRTVNDSENLISTKYSPGIAFFTNDLNIDTNDGQVNLKTFYQTNVIDFGNMMLSQAKENGISAVDGLSPDPATLNPANFKVVAVNDHKLDQAEVDSIRKKQADKITLESEITELEKSIDKRKEELNSKKFNSETDRRSVKNQLDTLIRDKSTKSSLYASIVKELAVIAQQKPAALAKPMYRVRGFFGIPNPKQSDKTGPQSVMQFYTYYRYVRPDGSQSDVKQFDYTDQNGQIKRGTYSNLVENRSIIRKKVYDVGTGKYVWASEDVENPNSVNINQVDIPISKGEKVEFYVVSVSEAGWPENPLLSDPSNVITIEFPNNLSSEDEASLALAQAQQEVVRVQLENDLQAKGLDIHLSSSFNSIEKYYAHDANVISSNFYTPEGNVISLYEKLKELQNRILVLEDRINKVAGVLSVFILDPATNTKTPIKNASVIQLFAGYYLDYASLLPAAERRGAIISKTYQIAIQNSEATPLQLVAKFPGGVGSPLPFSGATVPTFPAGSPYDSNVLYPTTNDNDYTKFRKYDQAPIVQPSIGGTDTNNANKYATAFYQSGQASGQFIYSRYKDVGLVNDLYESPTTRYYVPDFTTGSINTYIWNGAAIAAGGLPVSSGKLNGFCIHREHPLLKTPSTNITAQAANLQLPLINIDSATKYPIAPEGVSAFRHSYGIDLESKTVNGYSTQLSYGQSFLLNTTNATTYQPLSLDELPDKFGFLDYDRYLVGYQTCGSYLFLAPSTFNQLNVNGVDARSTYTVNSGDENAILIPVIFQWRMEDFYGDDTGTGAGILGGYGNPTYTVAPKNLSYGKRIGIDIYAQDEGSFSFDIQVSAIYKKTSLSQVVASATPSVNKTLQNIVYSKDTIKTLNT